MDRGLIVRTLVVVGSLVAALYVLPRGRVPLPFEVVGGARATYECAGKPSAALRAEAERNPQIALYEQTVTLSYRADAALAVDAHNRNTDLLPSPCKIVREEVIAPPH